MGVCRSRNCNGCLYSCSRNCNGCLAVINSAVLCVFEWVIISVVPLRARNMVAYPMTFIGGPESLTNSSWMKLHVIV